MAVTTEPGFSVDSGGTALTIRGTGPVSYDDANASVLNGRGGDGLLIVNDGGAGRVTVRTAGDITGTVRGVLVNNLGNGGINIDSTGTVTGVTRGISALAVANLGAGPNDDIDIVSNNTSGEIGVGAENRGGNGSIRIVSTGTASGTVVAGFGITAFHSITGAGRDVVITANNVGGAGGGISSSNRGTGSTSITVNGTLDVAARQGITVTNSVGTTSLSVTTNGTVTSGATGITVQNDGTGDTTIIARGQVTSRNLNPDAALQSGNGINLIQGATAGNASISAAGVDGRAGILLRNDSTGTIAVDSSGLVRGREGRGIEITNSARGGAITIGVTSVEGATDGIHLSNLGDSAVSIAASGPITGTSGTGINASTFGTLAVNVTDVSGTDTGLLLSGGDVALRATGTLAAIDGDGLFVQATGALEARIANSRGGRNGATIGYLGTGTGSVISSGNAIGNANGIFAESEGGDISLDVNNATGGDFGISLATSGGGNATVVTRGTIEGGIAAIDASLGGGNAPSDTAGQTLLGGSASSTNVAISAAGDNAPLFSLTNQGTIRNTTGSSADLAIQVAGGQADIRNNGTLIGTLSLGASIVPPEDTGSVDQRLRGAMTRARAVIAEVPIETGNHRFTNAGSWNSIGGTSLFGGSDDVLVNLAGGRLIGGVSATLAETTTYSGLETLTNQGIVTMADGGLGDIVHTSGNASFASGSVLAVDVGGSGSDRFIADGVTVIAAGARLQVSNPQPLVLGTRYTVLESAGGVSGAFTFTDELLSAFIGYRQGQTATTIFVEMAKLRAFGSVGVTPNQIEVGETLDVLAPTDPLARATLLLPTEAAARLAFDSLSGEIHPGVRTAMIEDTRLPRNAVMERLDGRNGGAAWGQAFGNWGNSDGANGVADLRRETIGGIMG
ncbi:MAG: hypothetical protein EOP58_01205, partial [Sphingomonadales bacterium]